MSYFMHESAVVDDGAQIGAGTKVWHFSHIMSTATIGQNCILGQNVFVGAGVHVGNGVKIQNNVSVYSGVYVEDDVFIGPSAVFTNVNEPRSFFEQKDYAKTKVSIGATIGANATIVCGHTVGKYAFIGAGAVVTKDVPDFAMMYGVPAQIKGWVSREGQRLNFNSEGEATCPKSGQRYQLHGSVVSLVE